MSGSDGIANAVVRAGRLKAHIRLAQAIKEFEKDLPDEQKAELQTPSIPESADVMRLTAQFDRALLLKGMRGFGPRMTVFFEAVQQFAAIGDLLIGGSQSLPACAVWSLVRFSIMAMLNIPAHINKLTTLFMELGRFAPRYSNLQPLFHKSKTLQTCLVEYHVVVVQLCHKILRLATTSQLKLLLNSFNDSTMGFRTDLERWAGDIRDEVAILMAIQIKSDSDENSSFRGLVKQFVHGKDTANLRAKFIALCCQHDHRRAWTRIRKSGNARFFLQDVGYLAWRDESLSAALVFTGILGSGKSVLLANVVDDLFLTYNKLKSTTVAFFFCEQNDIESLEASTILGSLAGQLLAGDAISDGNLFELQKEHAKKTSLWDNDFSSIILMSINSGSNIVFVLDGVDECSEDTRALLFKRFKEFRQAGKFRLCLAHRLQPNARPMLWANSITNAAFVSMPTNNPDIPIFVHSELKLLVETGKLVVGDETLLDEIEKALVGDSEDMFLWVALQISTLCLMESDHDIRRALRDLPKTLHNTYARLLDLAGVHGVQHRKSLLEIILSSLRPLTVGELQEALSIIPGDTKYDQSKVITDILRVLSRCKGLVVVDEESNTVSFVHPTVIRFLLEADSLALTYAECDLRMTERVLTYANYPLYDKRLVKAGEQHLDVGFVPRTVLDSALDSSTLSDIFVRAVHRRKVDLRRLYRSQDSRGDQRDSAYPFSSYLADHWCNHLPQFQATELITKTLEIATGLILEDTIGVILQDTTSAILLRKALSKGTLTLDGGLNREMTRKDPLMKAVMWNNADLFAILLAHMPVSTRNRSYALWLAANFGSTAIMEVMLGYRSDRTEDEKFDANWRDPLGHTPLHAAVWRNDIAVAGWLLRTDRSIMDVIDKNGQTALIYAAGKGAVECVVMLLRRNANVNVVDNNGENALTIAHREGHARTVEILQNNERIYEQLIEPILWEGKHSSWVHVTNAWKKKISR